MGTKLSHQVNPRLSASSYEAIDRMAKREGKSMGAVARVLIELVLPYVRETDTTASLTRGIPGRLYSRRVSEDLQDQLHSALDIIFARAPSAVIEEVERVLTKLAGKYGDEK